MISSGNPAGPYAGVQILAISDDNPDLDIIEANGRARALVWPAIGARYRSMHLIELSPNGLTMPLSHPSEAVYYVCQGAGEVLDQNDGKALPLIEGAMVHISKQQGYRFRVQEHRGVLIGGPCPPDPAMYGSSGINRAQSGSDAEGAVRLFHRDRPSMRLPMISNDARFVVWPGVGAESANMNYVVMEPGEANIPHSHPQSEDTIHILEGKGTVVNFDSDQIFEFSSGQTIHVAAGVKHAVRADRGERVVSVGGPCPADRAMLRRAGVLENGEKPKP